MVRLSKCAELKLWHNDHIIGPVWHNVFAKNFGKENFKGNIKSFLACFRVCFTRLHECIHALGFQEQYLIVLWYTLIIFVLLIRQHHSLICKHLDNGFKLYAIPRPKGHGIVCFDTRPNCGALMVLQHRSKKICASLHGYSDHTTLTSWCKLPDTLSQLMASDQIRLYVDNAI